MYEKDYKQKVERFINENSISKLNKNPTAIYQKRIKNLINNSKVLFDKNEIGYLKMINPAAPELRGLPKVHKEGVPIRPLVNYTSAPSYKIAKKLEKIIKTNMVLERNYSLSNSYDLINEIKDSDVKMHHILASFDITSLYTNIPVDETLDILHDKLNQSSSLLPEAIDELINLLKEILKQNYFMFQGEFYSQSDGLAMGSPLSGILSDVYLNFIENKFILSENNKYRSKIIFYHRYVDDTLILFDGNTCQLNLLHNYLNKIAPKFKFTLEIEENKRINFLDLTIEKENNKFNFSIYRKPTTSNQTIHSTSYHPYKQKIAAYNSLIYRLLNVPLNHVNL
uniref:Reverse transcriptase domain-containing protein n=1 Tax=Clastoptera arizonana TaxID=38151 RepID=A0A1B6C8J6_9HEMI